jgi:peroxiredoxin
MIKVGDKLPAVTLYDFVDVAVEGCPIGPRALEIPAALANKRVALFALPGAFTPTCSAQHLPGFVEHADALGAAGVDEIWCVSVNDAFVMAAWGKDQQVNGRVRMLADGSGDLATSTGLIFDLSAKGFGVRSQRYSMLLDDGKVVALNLDLPGKFDVSGAETLLAQAKQLSK